ncbi:S-layer homology domain-containing protein, partial [Acutalibacter caecimuris]|uniref:S-layer homology domain-containing protein n=1 Tax=Acutalibacter caecimuris TaxID=3093657 RepID=UPI002AC91D28
EDGTYAAEVEELDVEAIEVAVEVSEGATYEITNEVAEDKITYTITVTPEDTEAEAKTYTLTVTKAAVVDTDFGDVNPDAFYAGYLESVVSAGLITGTGTGADGKPTFNPNGTMVRADMAIVMARLAGYTDEDWKAYESTSGNPFSDVAKTGTYGYAYGAIMLANDQGWIVGDGTYFTPGRAVTREQAVSIIGRYTKFTTEKEPVAFTDAAQISNWAKE